MKKAILVLLIIALIISTAGCTGKNSKEPVSGTAIDTPGITGIAPQSTVIATPSTNPTSAPQATAMPQVTPPAKPQATAVPEDPSDQWVYLDPSLVAISGEGDE